MSPGMLLVGLFLVGVGMATGTVSVFGLGAVIVTTEIICWAT